jgi:hypothetical protein
MRLIVLFTFLVMSLASACKHRDPDGTKIRSQDAMNPESISWEVDAQKLLNEIHAELDSRGIYDFSAKTGCVEKLKNSSWTPEQSQKAV